MGKARKIPDEIAGYTLQNLVDWIETIQKQNLHDFSIFLPLLHRNQIHLYIIILSTII